MMALCSLAALFRSFASGLSTTTFCRPFSNLEYRSLNTVLQGLLALHMRDSYHRVLFTARQGSYAYRDSPSWNNL